MCVCVVACFGGVGFGSGENGIKMFAVHGETREKEWDFAFGKEFPSIYIFVSFLSIFANYIYVRI